MTLEIEKLTADIEQMAQGTRDRQQERRDLVQEALARLRSHGTDWTAVEAALDRALQQVNRKRFRAARPLDHEEPLDAAIDPGPLPDTATLVATDGSQILPNRHASYLYSLINIGVMIYYHGGGRTPRQYTEAQLDYPDRAAGERGRFEENAAIINVLRDEAEMKVLARSAWEQRHEPGPTLALLDQRLLYWPVSAANAESEGVRVLQAWQQAMSEIRACEAWLAGYIVRPRKDSVLTLLASLSIDEPDFDPERLTGRDLHRGLTDAHLFAELLEPGQRSKVFVDISAHNEDFAENDPANEVCFFYFNPGRAGRQIARIDVPISVAREPGAVSAMHALLVDQCDILGDYPYVLARADEIAVVGRRDQEHLDAFIATAMARQGLVDEVTAKQSSKEIARAGKSRHQV
ncbi:MAG: DNA double-strand break repair nuclease NurA [Candidatus Promineifilaceae bacterium]|nr:DNA double-strand break repair nuclease NurA [Candidatus Promineifilaceae bacterium]